MFAIALILFLLNLGTFMASLLFLDDLGDSNNRKGHVDFYLIILLIMAVLTIAFTAIAPIQHYQDIYILKIVTLVHLTILAYVAKRYYYLANTRVYAFISVGIVIGVCMQLVVPN